MYIVLVEIKAPHKVNDFQELNALISSKIDVNKNNDEISKKLANKEVEFREVEFDSTNSSLKIYYSWKDKQSWEQSLNGSMKNLIKLKFEGFTITITTGTPNNKNVQVL